MSAAVAGEGEGAGAGVDGALRSDSPARPADGGMRRRDDKPPAERSEPVAKSLDEFPNRSKCSPILVQ